MQDQLARDFLERMLAEKMVAGSPSFEVGPGRGDARRSRKGLSPTDVQRLIEAEFADESRFAWSFSSRRS
jgi:hypothetical protein